MNIKSHVGEGVNNPYVTNPIKIDKSFKEGGRNFVFLIKEAQPAFEEMCELVPEACQGMISSTASGTVLYSDNSSVFVLTAAHFCIEDPESGVCLRKKYTALPVIGRGRFIF